MYFDDPITYSQKYGIILRVIRFNHNIRKLICRKYKILYIKSLIVGQQQYTIIGQQPYTIIGQRPYTVIGRLAFSSIKN